MISASLVLYKTSNDELTMILNCIENSTISVVYVIDNSPTDVSFSVAKNYAKVKYLFGHGNIGYGAAHNLILEYIDSSFDYHVVLNPDIVFDKNVITSLKNFMDLNDEVGWLMPKITYPNGEVQFLCKLLPTPFNLLYRRFFSMPLFKSYNDAFELKQSGYDHIFEVPFLSGCFMFLRVKSFIEIKGFSDRFWMYCEDLDMCRRMNMSSFKTVFYPFVSVIHAHRKESFKNKKMLLAHIKSAFIYFNKWGWFFDSFRDIVNKNCLKQFE